ncbi:poly(A)-specific ribonuclease PARN-like [Fagus crenata]
MAPVPQVLQRRFLCQKSDNKWRSVKQVSKSNFAESLSDIKTHIAESDFIAVSLQRTGSVSSPWHRALPFDTPDTAYSKSKHSAERFQLLQFAVCPFSITARDTLLVHPYNFNLFPRDELKIGMPSYSFSCQTSYLTTMAQQGFDFNACIYDGISYLSRAQESAARVRIGNPTPIPDVVKSSSNPTVADSVFIERIKSRIKYWRNACKDSSAKTDEALVRSLRKLILGTEEYGTRPCMNIDVCTERQVQLLLEMLEEFSDDLVPLIIPAKGGATQVVRVILTSSKEDKVLFQKELQNLEEEQNKKVRGFREVIDLISASQKPVVSQNSLNDFTFIHSKFLAPLPPNFDEFMCTLRMVFPLVLDIRQLMKEIGPLRKVTNMPTAISYLKDHFFAPIDMEIPHEDIVNEGKIHGHNVLSISHLFAKLCSILKIAPIQSDNKNSVLALEKYASILNPCSLSPQESTDGDINVWTNNTRKVNCEHLVFLWGFKRGMTAGMLKSLLQGSHDVFSQEFDVRFVDRSCAIVVFWKPGHSETFLDVINSKEIFGPIGEMVSEGLRAACYGTYKKVCRLGILEADLAKSLDKALEEPDRLWPSDSETNPSEVYWCSDSIINFDDL